jgi:DNA-binding CsgD family transcriptional regulator/tetratricopeptide (TPR) repeat protein
MLTLVMSESLPLRGRDAEFAVIGELLATAALGEGSAVVIEGRAGFGKTRLLQAAVEQAAIAGLRTGRGGAADGSQAAPMTALMSALFDGREPLLDRAKLRELPSAPEQRFWLLQELAALLEAAALAGPLLIGLDDLQWADSGTLAALRSLPDQLSGLPIVWMVALRPEGAPGPVLSVVEQLRRLGAHRLDLGPLGSEAVGQVLRDFLGAEADQNLADVAASTDGNPFVLAELLHGLRDEGRLRFEDGRVHVAGTQLPARLQQSMRLRLGYRSPMAQQLAGVAAVLGRSFSLDQLAGMLERPATALLGPVDELIGAGLIIEDGPRLAFGHDLIREAVLETLPASSRRALQRRAVDVFLAEGVPPAEVARQLADSADPGDHAAVSLLSRAAEALRALDSGAAADLAVKALELAAPDDALRGPLVAQAAILLFAAGRPDEGLALAEGALRELLPAEQQAEIYLTISVMFSVPSDVREQACRRGLLLDGLSELTRLRLRARLAYTVVHVGKLAEAQQMIDRLEPDVAASDDPTVRFAFEMARQTVSMMEDDFSESLRAALASRGSVPTKTPIPAFMTDMRIIESLAMRDRFDEALELIGARLTAAQRDGQFWVARSLELARGRYWAAAGRLEDAAAALQDVSPTQESHRVANTVDAAVLAALGRVALHTDDQRQSDMCARTARLAMSMLSPEPRQHLAWLIALRRMAAAGDASGARAILTEGRDPDVPVLPRFWIDPADPPHLVRIALACGDDQLAAQAVAIAEHRSQRNAGVGSLAAIAEHARGLRDDDIGQLRQAAERFAASPRRLARASATEDLGRLLARGGQTAEGARRLNEALELYIAMGASWDATRVRGLLRRLGIRRNLPAVQRAAGWAGLTESELAVVRLVAAGQTNPQVAAQLFLSPNTISTHLRRIFAKLGIRSRVELVRLFVSHTGPGSHERVMRDTD